MASFAITTLGCKVNRAESDRIAAQLIARGWVLKSQPRDADLAIVNTCTVTGEAEHKNRKVIRQLLKETPGPVLVTGCAINIAPDHYRDLDDRVVVECNKESISARANQLIKTPHEDHSSAPDEKTIDTLRTSKHFRTRVDIKVQDGCGHACTYCIVHTARGLPRSKPLDRVIEEVGDLASGAAELVLVGIDLAAYHDPNTGADLAGLISAIEERTDVGRIRISSVEPQSLTPSLIDLLAASDGRLCRHLHICLQSGSNKVLREMGRAYTAEEFLAYTDALRKKVPGIALSTDVIVGFPGETEGDFQETCAVVSRAKFMRLHVFRYSKRPGTPAAVREDQIDPKIATRRAHELRELGKKLAREDMRARIGTVEQVVVERTGFGTSESYHAVQVPEGIEPGSMVALQLADMDSSRNCFIGEIAS